MCLRRSCWWATCVRAVTLGSLLLVTSSCGLVGRADGTDHAVVQMFDPRMTTLTLRRTETGGVEAVVVRDTSDATQVELVRARVRDQMAEFQRGDHQDPAKAHGMVMPGSRELEAAYAEVDAEYADLPAGGQITYKASKPAVVDLIHAWFERRDLAR